MNLTIKEVSDYYVKFSDDSIITFSHDQDWDERNYADFKAIDDMERSYAFNDPIRFEAVPDSGFRFGDEGKMVFVPCYSSQNGYYSNDIDIIYAGNPVLNFNCARDYD